MQVLLWILVSVAVGYIFICLLMYIFQSGMMYYPVKDIYQTPAALGLEFEEVAFESQNGSEITGWYVPANAPRGTVLFSHGNAGNISGRLETLRILNSLNLNVLIYDYQGYGNSKGSSSEETTYQDAMAAWRFLNVNKQIPPSEIILMGRSLGGAISAWLATKTEPAALILESTFTSAKDLAAEIYPIFPVRLLMKFEYPTAEYVEKISIPILITHSTEDQLVPYHHGRELYEIASQPKSFFKMSGNHGNSHIVTGKEYVRALKDFVNLKVLTKLNQKK